MNIVKRVIPAVFNHSFFLFGPRGTGKSLWLRNTFPDAYFIDLLKPDIQMILTAEPSRLEGIIKSRPETRIFVIDEIQKIPVLLTLVHAIIENNPEICFILTGSSSRKLKKSGVDMLAGRAYDKHCHPFMACEIDKTFNLDKAIKYGMVPLILAAPDPEEALSAYINLYLREEIQIEGFVRNLGAFSRFLEAVSFSHGSVLNTSEVARECMVNRKTVEGYIQILEDMLLSIRLPVFSKKAKRQLISHEKFYFFDAGVYNQIRPRGPLDKQEEIAGPAMEGLILQHLRAWKDYSRQNTKLYYWRTKSGLEVDFIVYGEHTFTAIEVKHSRSVHKKDLRGLKSFIEDYPEATSLLLYRGTERQMVDNILCLPIGEFLLNLKPDGLLFQ